MEAEIDRVDKVPIASHAGAGRVGSAHCHDRPLRPTALHKPLRIAIQANANEVSLTNVCIPRDGETEQPTNRRQRSGSAASPPPRKRRGSALRSSVVTS